MSRGQATGPLGRNVRHQKMRKGIISGSVAVLCVYVLIYLGLTLGGRYEAASVGPSHVKSWGWAPYGFHDGTFWRPKMMYFFAPLYVADQWCWHTDRAVIERPERRN